MCTKFNETNVLVPLEAVPMNQVEFFMVIVIYGDFCATLWKIIQKYQWHDDCEQCMNSEDHLWTVSAIIIYKHKKHYL